MKDYKIKPRPKNAILAFFYDFKRRILVRYYLRRADSKMDKIVRKKGLTQEKLDQIAKEHHRTPYR